MFLQPTKIHFHKKTTQHTKRFGHIQQLFSENRLTPHQKKITHPTSTYFQQLPHFYQTQKKKFFSKKKKTNKIQNSPKTRPVPLDTVHKTRQTHTEYTCSERQTTSTAQHTGSTGGPRAEAGAWRPMGACCRARVRGATDGARARACAPRAPVARGPRGGGGAGGNAPHRYLACRCFFGRARIGGVRAGLRLRVEREADGSIGGFGSMCVEKSCDSGGEFDDRCEN